LVTSKDPILQDLIDHEKSVVEKVEAARSEAARLVAQAASEARSIVEVARSEADALMTSSVDRTRVESDTARGAILDAAQAAADALTRSAKERRDAAAKLVLERVLP
jgi:vacuolar-type H+-ATPase subunit H